MTRHPRPSRVRLVAAAVATAVSLTGCTSTVTGTPVAASGSEGSAEFDKLLQECVAVPNEQIAATIRADAVEQYFYGAVCMWTGSGPTGTSDVTFAWFENNSLERERALAEELNYSIEPVTVSGASAFVSRRPGDAASCGVTASYSGTITWWVQYRDGAVDPCEGATRLAELTMQRNQ